MKLQEFFNTGDLEFGPEAIAADKQLATNIQIVLIHLGFLDPPADGLFGPISTAAMIEFQGMMSSKESGLEDEKGFLGKLTAKALIETSIAEVKKLSIDLSQNDLAAKIIQYMQEKRYQIATGAKNYNIVYVEDMDGDGNPVSNQPNSFNDRRMVIEILNNIPLIVGNWEATTEPGTHFTLNPMNPNGAARIAFGQYKAWRVGTHCGASGNNCHEALVQVEDVSVFRDKNKDFIRTGDKLFTGQFGIIQHHGFDLPRNNIALASAGSLVGRTIAGHQEFMQLIKQDRRFQLSNSYKFLTTIIPGDEL
jgi:peptidoglycan hydrolase-like protein with peptidoglycan-binding domain